MKGKHGRFGWTWIAIAVATAALAAPTAQARHSPGDTAAPSQSPTAADDRLGPKYVEMPARPAASRPRTIEVVTPSRFRWDDALIAAGATALAIATIGAATLVVTRRRGSSLPAGLGVQAAPKERLG
jgi:hypothetical protein